MIGRSAILSVFTLCFSLTAGAQNIDAQTKVYVIGTTHQAVNCINSEALEDILNKIRPDVILVEVDSSFLTKDFHFDLEKYPDILSSSMENTAVNRYKQKNQVVLRPFDITGRNEFYRQNDYFAKEDGLFGELLDMKANKDYSEENERLFDLAWSIIELYAEAENITSDDINSDVRQKFTELKYATYDTFLNICENEPKLHKWIDFARLQRDFWIRRNQTMVDNISLFAEEFRGKTIAVIVGFEHKYFIVNKLRANKDIELVN